MREILFRGKRVGLNSWVEGCISLYSEPGAVEMTYPIEAEDEEFNTYDDFDYAEVIPETVGQYVGMDDKNGRKIFEGDIVRNISREGDIVGVIVFRNCGFELDCRKYIEFPMKKAFTMNDSELGVFVLGNIHDNPELLEGNNHEQIL